MSKSRLPKDVLPIAAIVVFVVLIAVVGVIVSYREPLPTVPANALGHAVSSSCDLSTSLLTQQTLTVTVGGKKFVITAAVQGKRAMLTVNGQTTRFLRAGQSATLADGTTVTVTRVRSRSVSFCLTLGAYPSCGDGSCSTSETCNSCSRDCGSCPTATCTASSVQELRSCFTSQGTAKIELGGDIRCEGQGCCGTSQGFLVSAVGQHAIWLEGNGRTIERVNAPAQCGFLQIAGGSSNILVSNLRVVETSATGPCKPEECSPLIKVHSSSNVTFSRASLVRPRSIGIYVWSSRDVHVEDSQVDHAGVHALYVGHADYGASSGFVLRNSVISNSRTNGLAIEGVTGMSAQDNLIENNVFLGNHYQGLWTASAPNGTTVYSGGGQVYLAMLDHLTFRNNLVFDGSCANCYANLVFGVELGKPDRERAVSHLTIEGNQIVANAGPAASLNWWAGSRLDETTLIRNNRLYNNQNPSWNRPTIDVGVQTDGTHALVQGNSETYFEPTPPVSLDGLGYRTLYQYQLPGDNWATTKLLGYPIKSRYRIAASQEPGTVPVYDCLVNGNNHMLSYSCEMEGVPYADTQTLGYAYPPGDVVTGTRPIYRCSTGADHFITENSSCDGYAGFLFGYFLS